MHDCGCSEEYGPCESHADVLVIRQGAALHTADELALLLISDLIDCGVKLTDEQRDEYEALEARLEADQEPEDRTRHFAHHDSSQQASDFSHEVEQDAESLYVAHDDGYVISRPHDDCPLLEG